MNERDVSDDHDGPNWAVIRPEAQRPSLRRVITRCVIVVVVNTLVLWFLAWLISGFTIDTRWDALLAGAVVGIINALIWPALAVLVVPLSVLTLGLGAILLNALFVYVVLDELPGVTLADFWTALLVTIGLTVVSAVVSAILAIDDDAWVDERFRSRARRIAKKVPPSEVPGVVFLQVDGLAEVVLRRALRSGDVPTLHRWLRDGSHHLRSWETDWSSQTGVSQCGILHGSTKDMPAFRWLDKETGTIVVSNQPASAKEIERRHSDGNGLLAVNGSSYANLYSGDAERAVLTMSGAGRVKEGRIGAGYGGYFTRADQATRTLVSTVAEIARERRAAGDQRRRDVEPRVERDWTYALLRAFTTIVSRDVCVTGILNDMAEGRSAIYIDFLGYDEVSHHSGPERADTLAVLRDIDKQIGRLQRASKWCPRPYRFVVLSDHGQTQGAAFHDRYGESLAELVERLVGADTTVDPDSEAGNTESSAWLRRAKGTKDKAPKAKGGTTVLASGNLGLVYLPGEPRRLTLEEIDSRWPDLIPGLRAHPGVGFILVKSEEHGSLILGASGSRRVSDGAVDGEDPLAPFGDHAENTAAKIARVDGFTTVADLMINSVYDPELDEVAAFEAQVGSHGGLGGPQTHPFLLHPAELVAPEGAIEGSVALHHVLKGWLADLGHEVALSPEAAARRTAS